MVSVEGGRFQHDHPIVEQPRGIISGDPGTANQNESLYPLTTLGRVLAKGKVLLRPDGIHASLDGFFQRPFGRDTFYTNLGLLFALEDFGLAYVPEETLVGSTLSYLNYMSRKGLLPHEVGTAAQGYPFPINRNGIGRHFASVDVNGLAILVLDKLLSLFPNNEQLRMHSIEPMRKMVQWTLVNAGKHDGMIGYTFGSKYGSREKTWQDGTFSIFDENGALPPHPMHTVLEQGLYWSALQRAGDRLAGHYPKLARKARYSSERIKANFNQNFVYKTDTGLRIARAIDGRGNKITLANIDSLIALGFDYGGETILNNTNSALIEEIVNHQVSELETEYGLRTQGVNGLLIEGFGYHAQSSLWPFANGLAARSLEKNALRSAYLHEMAIRISEGTEKLLLYFDSPIETAQIDSNGNLSRYEEKWPNGKVFLSSMIQAWTVGWGVWIDTFLQVDHRRSIKT